MKKYMKGEYELIIHTIKKMDNIFITLFILVANVVAVLLTYNSFDRNLEKTKRFLYTMISIGIMYIFIVTIYFFSSLGLSKEATESAKNMITFTFVPVNTIILVPVLIRAFKKKKNNIITTKQLNTRTIMVVVIGVILLISEFFYFRNIQKGIIDIVEQKNKEQSQNEYTTNLESNKIYNNTILNVENVNNLTE